MVHTGFYFSQATVTTSLHMRDLKMHVLQQQPVILLHFPVLHEESTPTAFTWKT